MSHIKQRISTGFAAGPTFYFEYQTANQHFTRIDFCTKVKKNEMYLYYQELNRHNNMDY